MGVPAATIAATQLCRAELLRLRRARVPYDQIVERLGYSSENVARKEFSRAKKQAREMVADEADAMRDLISEGYDAIIEAYQPAALAGDIKAADLVRRTLADQAKLWGVNAPLQVEATITEITQQDVALQEMIAEAKAQNAAKLARLQARTGSEAQSGDR